MYLKKVWSLFFVQKKYFKTEFKENVKKPVSDWKYSGNEIIN